MAKDKEPKEPTKMVGIYLPLQVHAELEAEAKKNLRTMSNMAIVLILEALAARRAKEAADATG